jgi:hypothetical protein
LGIDRKNQNKNKNKNVMFLWIYDDGHASMYVLGNNGKNKIKKKFGGACLSRRKWGKTILKKIDVCIFVFLQSTFIFGVSYN